MAVPPLLELDLQEHLKKHGPVRIRPHTEVLFDSGSLAGLPGLFERIADRVKLVSDS